MLKKYAIKVLGLTVVVIVAITIILIVNRDLEWQPDGEWIVFSCDNYRTGEIYRIRPDGSKLERLTHLKLFVPSPNWSPNGDWITFSKSGAIYVMRPDGSDKSLILQTDVGIPVFWLPEQSLIIFTTFDAILSITPDGNVVENILSIDKSIIYPLSLSTDQQEIFLNISLYNQTIGYTDEIYVVDLHGTKLEKLSDSAYNSLGGVPIWSPDKKNIAILQPVRFLILSDISLVDNKGSQIFSVRDDLLDMNYFLPPSWSPDGNYFVFSASKEQWAGYELYTVDINSRKVKQITDFDDCSTGWPRWSPQPN